MREISLPTFEHSGTLRDCLRPLKRTYVVTERAPTVLSAVVVMWLCAFPVSAFAQTVSVQWNNERVSITATHVPVADVLAELKRLTGLTVVDGEKLVRPVTLDLNDVFLIDALQAVLVGYDYLIGYSSISDSPYLMKVWARPPTNAAGVVTPRISPLIPDPISIPAVTRASGVSDIAIEEPAAAPDNQPTADTSEPFPLGPSPAEAEAARLTAQGFFNPNAPEGSLLSLAKSPDSVVRTRALQTLAVQGNKVGYDAITSALEDENPFVRGEALDLLLNFSGPSREASGRLGELLGNQDPGVRLPAALALAEQSDAESDFQLKRALEDDAVKAIVSEQLRRKGNQEARQSTKKVP